MEDNKLIAEFMGYEPNENGIYPIICQNEGKGWHLETMKFHYDWNWLMTVVEKIESLGVVVEIRENVCYIETSQGNYTSELEETKIQATYKAVVGFIKWYNNNN